jgi:transcriptional regulator with XRE-family HTH domain
MAKPNHRSGVPVFEKKIGIAIRARRLELGMSQTALAEAVGITFQQVQKYETGKNRVAASRLYLIAQELDCPVTQLMPLGKYAR